MLRRVLMTVACLVALGVAVPAAADPTDPADTTPSTSPSTVPSASASNDPANQSPVSTPAAPTQPSVEPSSSSDPSDPASATESSPTRPTSASSSSPSAGRSVSPTSQGTVADGPSVLSAGGPLAAYVTVYCNGDVHIVVDNPAPGITYTYRLVAQPGTDPVDRTGPIEMTRFGPVAILDGVPLGTYTAEVTGTDDGAAVSAPFTVAEPCQDPPLIFFRIRQVPCGPGDETTGISGYLENPKDDEVYTWHVVSENGEMDPVSGPVAPDGTFTLTGLVPGTFSVIFSGDEGSAFESNSFAVYPCPTPTPTPPPSAAPSTSPPPSSSPPPSTASSPTASAQPISSVAGNTGDTAGLAATGAGRGLLALLAVGVVALLTGVGVVLSRVRTGRRG